MKKYLPALFFALTMVFSLLLLLWNLGLPRPLSLQEKIESPGAMRALELLKAIAKDPHPVGSGSHKIVSVYIQSLLEDWGYDFQIMEEPGTNDSFRGKPMELRSAQVKNILAVVPGKVGKMVLLVAHYDSVPGSNGAGDDGLGTVALLEVLRAMKGRWNPELTLGFLFTDAEELGMVGASSFVKNHLSERQIETVINVEGLTTGPVVITETGTNRQWYPAYYFAGAKKMPITSLMEGFFRFLPFGTDLNEFEEAGLDGVTISPVADFFLYHSPGDNAKNINPGTMQQALDQVMQMAIYASSGKLKYEEGGKKNAFAFFPGLLLTYDYLMSMFLIAFSLIAIIFVFVRKNRLEKMTWLSGLAGFGLSLLVLAGIFFTGLVALNLTDMLLSVVAGKGIMALKGSLYQIILCLASFGVAVLFGVLDRIVIKKMFGVKTSLASYLLIFLIIGTVMNFVLFQASYIVLIPVILTALACLVIGFFKNVYVRAGICALAGALVFSLVLQAVCISASALAGFSLYAVYLLLFLSAVVLPLSLHAECHETYFVSQDKK
jgi:hypothetical protein